MLPRRRPRSDRYAPAGPGYVPTRVRDWPNGAGGDLSSADLLTYVSDPLAIPPGDQLRRAPCLICLKPAGGGPVRAVVLVHLGQPATSHGALECRAQMVHDGCMPDTSLDLHHAAHRTDNPSCRCGWPA